MTKPCHELEVLTISTRQQLTRSHCDGYCRDEEPGGVQTAALPAGGTVRQMQGTLQAKLQANRLTEEQEVEIVEGFESEVPCSTPYTTSLTQTSSRKCCK